MTLKVLLVDDEELVRFGLRTVLESAGDIEVVGEASDGAAGLAAANQLRPDVVLIDIRMPGSTACQRPGQSWPGPTRPRLPC